MRVLVAESALPKVLVIVPCFNEAGNIETVVESIKTTGYDYIVVNDSSTDNSLEILQSKGYRHLALPINLGIGGAMQSGYRYALAHGYEVAVQFDGDGQHRAQALKQVVTPVLEGDCDMVIGSRFIDNAVKDKEEQGFQSTAARRLGIKILSKVMRWTTGKEIKDMTSGLRAVNKDIIALFAQDYPVEYPEPVTNVLVAKHDKRIKEVPVLMSARQHGRSSIGGLKSAYYMINTILLMLSVRKVKGMK